MSYNFVETFSLTIPDFNEKLLSFSESDYQANHGLVIEIAAIHAGTTSNFNHYSEAALQEGLNSWISPYPKPIILNHDPHSEPIGRIMGARMEKEDDGTPYTRLQAAILDPEAMKKVADGRYLTGSVGGKAEEAVCNICSIDWAAPKEGMGMPCKHQRGKVYSGKVAVLNIGKVAFKEYSMVNMPADGQSSVRKFSDSATDIDTFESWAKPARFFVLDMVNEHIFEYTESEDRNVLDGMRKKDALPLYMGLKGAFLSAQAIYESEKEEVSIKDSETIEKVDTNNDDGSDSDKETTNMQDTQEDILAITDDLSADLASVATETEEDSQEEVVEPAEDNTDAEATDESEVDDEAPSDAEESAPEGQERGGSAEATPDDSTGLPPSREEDSQEEQEVTDSEDEVELNTEDDSIEPRIKSLEEKVTTLETENGKLRRALHRNLVERVVDMKIGLGIVAFEERATEIQSHDDRTAASLADTLRDLAKMEPKAESRGTATEGLEMHQESEVVGNETNVTTIDDTDELGSNENNPEQEFEDILVQALMGRRSL